ncbi:hypothetical protein [Desertivirga xinjiangensis]|uniref:hypothetical protein n=1 Tax=Desertivirga xinjiangensis TaxID=539206 RepID=UPI00210DFCC5|nr:hypothetical protein [Pedobacter xinjiangensis]
MKRTAVLGLSFLLSTGIAEAQWKNQSTTWSYGFGDSKSATLTATADNAEYLSKNAASVLSQPSSGTVRLFIPGNTDGGFTIEPTSNTLTFSGSTVGSTKFSAYNIAGASEIASITFNVTFSNPDKQQATYYFSMGTKGKPGNLYNSANAVYTGANSGGALFNAVRFLYSNSGVTLGSRTVGNSTGKYATLSGGVLAYDTPYKIEMYMNNSPEAKHYSKSGKEQIVAANSYHLWVTNTVSSKTVLYSFNGSADLIRPTETNVAEGTDATIPANAVLNAFLIQSINAKPNTSALKISGNIELAYHAK